MAGQGVDLGVPDVLRIAGRIHWNALPGLSGTTTNVLNGDVLLVPAAGNDQF